jgi:hypothetical protein
MIFTKDVVFLHPPKTAGMSTTEYLLAVLPTPIFLSQPIQDDVLREGVIQLAGKRHETLRACFKTSWLLIGSLVEAGRLPQLARRSDGCGSRGEADAARFRNTL